MTSRGTPPTVEVDQLVKRYPKSEVNAVDGLSFTVEPGEIFGLFGPNGAGKSTTIGILTTRIRATSGRAVIGGVDVLRDPVGARAQLAVVPQHNNLDRSLTPRQNLLYHAAYHGVGRRERESRADDLLERFGLADRADKRIEAYSGGMAQRLMIARALIHEPAVLFLDEPTNGLDPQTRLLIWNRIHQMRDRGVSIVLTTHQMNDAAGLVDRVGVVDHGRLLTLDTPTNLVRSLAGRSILDLTVALGPQGDVDALLTALREVSGVRKAEQLAAPALPAARRPGGFGANGRAMGPGRGGPPGPGGGRGLPPGLGAGRLAALGLGAAVGTLPSARARAGTRIRLHLATDPAALLGPILTLLSDRSANLTDVRVSEPSLEDVFIELTGRGLR
ncbi:ABC transporter ATP-binding protein [Micromonospora echinofusca]|uniref:ATP-binding cassette domain-containing protein n=1 Tax=Micromonospora echinofusca TaxID=47858 RepID=A0ABS3W045_MICEH|nr:ABC transporter ATP-binding protein [Micromonospora echinofusca]MBO4210160.1 ATP-binding cassette domain-containing protein [Micromonospora echinofusca]